jgi:hypothetical protein
MCRDDDGQSFVLEVPISDDPHLSPPPPPPPFPKTPTTTDRLQRIVLTIHNHYHHYYHHNHPSSYKQGITATTLSVVNYAAGPMAKDYQMWPNTNVEGTTLLINSFLPCAKRMGGLDFWVKKSQCKEQSSKKVQY